MKFEEVIRLAKSLKTPGHNGDVDALCDYLQAQKDVIDNLSELNDISSQQILRLEKENDELRQKADRSESLQEALDAVDEEKGHTILERMHHAADVIEEIVADDFDIDTIMNMLHVELDDRGRWC